ncbi:GNAT family N-acetyltransferase [Apibacter adventoris]|uniref:GNAT family N-acetyltransferase n=1 Tax=Apibacter adventoris TaxID=1679466 RepID=A0A2S8ACK6_9FLAO|nr:GNAT family N-acetyltransferase [Apibacter adventoris]PQL92668.1 GNAT family N-acetyltransferase [Apibacter adventoris]
MKIKIEEIVEEDFETLIELFRELAVFENLPEKMINSVKRMKAEKDFFRGFTIKDENNIILGYVTFFFAYYTWVGKSLYMDDLYIREEHRGKGLGTQLIKKVISFAKETNCQKLRWQVSNWNKSAIKFYKSLGAQIDEVDKNCDLMFDN